jgi:hypothetical protein
MDLYAVAKYPDRSFQNATSSPQVGGVSGSISLPAYYAAPYSGGHGFWNFGIELAEQREAIIKTVLTKRAPLDAAFAFGLHSDCRASEPERSAAAKRVHAGAQFTELPAVRNSRVYENHLCSIRDGVRIGATILRGHNASGWPIRIQLVC